MVFDTVLESVGDQADQYFLSQVTIGPCQKALNPSSL